LYANFFECFPRNPDSSPSSAGESVDAGKTIELAAAFFYFLSSASILEIALWYASPETYSY